MSTTSGLWTKAVQTIRGICGSLPEEKTEPGEKTTATCTTEHPWEIHGRHPDEKYYWDPGARCTVHSIWGRKVPGGVFNVQWVRMMTTEEQEPTTRVMWQSPSGNLCHLDTTPGQDWDEFLDAVIAAMTLED